MAKESDGSEKRGRWTSVRKVEVVLRLLHGEDLDVVSREEKVSAGRLAAWRDAFLDGGRIALKSRRSDVRDEEIRRLRSKVGELTMDKEALEALVRITERPFAERKSKK